MGRASRFAFLAALLVTALGVKTAQAGSCDRPLVSACINSDTLWPNAGPTRFASLSGTQTTARNQFAFGLLTTYQQRPIVLALPSPGPTGSKHNAINDQVTGNFLFGYGVTDRLALHVALPVTFGQGGSGTAAITGGDDLRDTALRDMRFGLALALIAPPRVDPDIAPDQGVVPSLALRFDTSAPTGDKTQFAGERGGVLAPGVAFGVRWARLFGTAEAGLRLRGVSQSTGGARVGSQATFGLGVGYQILARDLLSVTLEARLLPTFTEQSDTVQTTGGIRSTPNGIHLMPAEWMLGVRSAPIAGGDFVVTAGGGTGLPLGEEAITRPRIRAMLGLAYAPQGLDSDGDGVLDRDDACPGLAGIKTLPATPAALPPVGAAAAVEGAKNAPRRGCPLPREEEGPPADFVTPPPPAPAPAVPAPKEEKP